MITEVAVLRFPCVGEPDEFAALFADPRARARWVSSAGELGSPDLVVLPGSEKTMADLRWMRETGLMEAVLRAHREGAMLVGICGGFQILGTRLTDPSGEEGGAAEDRGLGLLPLTTEFVKEGIERPSLGTSNGSLLPSGTPVAGREIHGGRSTLEGPAVRLFDEPVQGAGSCPLGVATPDLRVIGTYLHDVLQDDAFRGRVLEMARGRRAR